MKPTTAIVMGIALTVSAAAWAEGPYASIYDTRRSTHSSYEWTFSSAVEFVTGRLGTSATTRSLYVPFTIQRNLPRGRVAVTVPYIGERTSPDVADHEGRLSQIRRTGSTSFINSGGLSDVILKGAYDFQREVDGDHYDLSAVARVKFPTSARTDGIGTGEADEAIGVESSKMLNENWFVMGDLYYTNTGDMAADKLENPFTVDAGFGYQWPEDVYLSVTYEDGGAWVQDRPRSRDFLFNIGKPINEDTDLTGNILWGLSEGAPDFGIGMGVNVRF